MSDIPNRPPPGLSIVEWLKRIERKLDKHADDHEKRLRFIERLMFVAVGLALAGGIPGAIAMIGG